MIDIISKVAGTEIATLDEAKIYFRAEESGGIEDDLIEELITSAREWMEEAMNRSIVSNTVTLWAEDFKGFLPYGRVSEITSPTELAGTSGNIQYVDVTSGVEIVYTTTPSPENIFKTGVLELAKWWYERGEDAEIPMKVLRIVRAFKLKP
jgi:hypothetical protein